MTELTIVTVFNDLNDTETLVGVYTEPFKAFKGACIHKEFVAGEGNTYFAQLVNTNRQMLALEQCARNKKFPMTLGKLPNWVFRNIERNLIPDRKEGEPLLSVGDLCPNAE